MKPFRHRSRDILHPWASPAEGRLWWMLLGAKTSPNDKKKRVVNLSKLENHFARCRQHHQSLRSWVARVRVEGSGGEGIVRGGAGWEDRCSCGSVCILFACVKVVHALGRGTLFNLRTFERTRQVVCSGFFVRILQFRISVRTLAGQPNSQQTNWRNN